VNYVVLIGDLKNSRRVEDRSAFEQTLNAALKKVNRRYKGTLLRELRSTQGIDLIVGVFKRKKFDAGSALGFALSAGEQLQREIFPETFRFGIGFGEIDIGVDKPLAQMDGPAFHYASDALEEAERRGLPFKINLKLPAENLTVDKDENDRPGGRNDHIESQLHLIEQTMRCLDVIRSDWTPRLPSIFEALEGRSQKEAAKQLGITPQAVSAAAKQGHFEEYRDTLGAVCSMFMNPEKGLLRP